MLVHSVFYVHCIRKSVTLNLAQHTNSEASKKFDLDEKYELFSFFLIFDGEKNVGGGMYTCLFFF